MLGGISLGVWEAILIQCVTRLNEQVRPIFHQV